MLVTDCLDLLEGYIKIMQVSVGRLAAICTWLAPHSKPAMTLAQRFCKDMWTSESMALARSENFELHAHKVYSLGPGMTVNSWIRHKSGFRRMPGERPEPAVVVEQDINTLAEVASEKVFTKGERDRFFQSAARELDEIMMKYYPEEP
jgi:hypothetical protein